MTIAYVSPYIKLNGQPYSVPCWMVRISTEYLIGYDAGYREGKSRVFNDLCCLCSASASAFGAHGRVLMVLLASDLAEIN